MKRSTLLAALVFAILSAAATANAQAASAAQQKPTFAAVYDRAMSSTEKEVVSAAEAMPEDKFNFTPESLKIPGSDYTGVLTLLGRSSTSRRGTI